MDTFIISRFKIVFFILVSLCANVFAETIVVSDGRLMKGRIGELSDDIVKFYSDKYYAIQLQNIRDAYIDDGLNESDKKNQQDKVDQLLFVVDQERHIKTDFRQKINDLLNNREFTVLDTIAEQLRKDKTRYASGEWKILDFYIGLRYGVNSGDHSEYENRIKIINQWIEKKPESTTAKIAFMSINYKYAWEFRGIYYSNTVTADGLSKFKKKLGEVVDMGELLLGKEVKDPMLYNYLAMAYLGYGKDKGSLQDLAYVSARLEPEFYYTYYASMFGLLPKWGGSKELVLRFLTAISSREGIREHPEIYYILVKSIYNDIAQEEYIDYGFDWSLINAGFQAYVQKYKEKEGDIHLMAKLASLHSDKQSAREYFSRTSGQWNSYARSVWDKKSVLQRFTAWSVEKESKAFNKVLQTVLSDIDAGRLHKAVKLSHSSGGNINQGDVLGNTLLHYAVKKDLYRLVGLLLDMGVDVNKADIRGRTVLHLAAEHNNSILINILLKSGADVLATTEEGRSNAMHEAAQRGFDLVVTTLLKSNTSLANSKNSKGSTSLHLAVEGGYTNVVNALLSNKAVDINARTHNSDTALHLAILRGHTDIVSLLMDSGANYNLKNKQNHTPLSLASEKGLSNIISLLSQAGAAGSDNVISKADVDKSVQLYLQASRNFNKKDYKKSIALYKKAIEYNSNYAKAYHSLSMVLWQFERNYAEADANITKAIELDPAFVESYYIAGRINYDFKKPDKYKTYFRRYVQLAPDTYNTRDLKKNYSHLLHDNAINVNQTDSMLVSSSWISNNRNYLITALLLLVLLLVIVKIRKT